MVNMEYKFVQTIHGPVVSGDDEILFFNEFGPLLDYVEEDPEFINKAKDFIGDNLMAITANLVNSMSQPVVGADNTQAIYGFITAINNIKQFEQHYLPSINRR
jgi:hypothetical protein